MTAIEQIRYDLANDLVEDIRRFRKRDHFAAHTGTAPVAFYLGVDGPGRGRWLVMRRR